MPPAIFLTEYHTECKILHIHGHLPLLNPWLQYEFCENSETSRISADKRFSLCHASRPSARDRGFKTVCNRKFNKKYKNITVRHKNFNVCLIYRVWAESVSASCGLASCNGRRSADHLPCDPRAYRYHCRYLMTVRIGLRHRNSRGRDAWHTSKSRWAALQLPVKTYKKRLASGKTCLPIALLLNRFILKSDANFISILIFAEKQSSCWLSADWSFLTEFSKGNRGVVRLVSFTIIRLFLFYFLIMRL